MSPSLSLDTASLIQVQFVCIRR